MARKYDEIKWLAQATAQERHIARYGEVERQTENISQLLACIQCSGMRRCDHWGRQCNRCGQRCNEEYSAS